MKLDDKNITNEEREMARNTNNFDGGNRNQSNWKNTLKIITPKNQRKRQFILKIIRELIISDRSLLKTEISMSKSFVLTQATGIIPLNILHNIKKSRILRIIKINPRVFPDQEDNPNPLNTDPLLKVKNKTMIEIGITREETIMGIIFKEPKVQPMMWEWKGEWVTITLNPTTPDTTIEGRLKSKLTKRDDRDYNRPPQGRGYPDDR